MLAFMCVRVASYVRCVWCGVGGGAVTRVARYLRQQKDLGEARAHFVQSLLRLAHRLL